MNEGEKAPEVGPDEATKPTIEATQPEEQGVAETSPAELPEENTMQPTGAESGPVPVPPTPVVTKEIEKQVIVKPIDQKSPKTVEKVMERVVEVPAAVESAVPPGQQPRSSKLPWILVAVLCLLLLAGGGFAWWYVAHHKNTQVSQTNAKQLAKTADTGQAAPKVQGLQLDSNKNYGNKYADGILPVGDGKYVTSAPKVGYGYACSQYAHNLETQAGGAGRPGPWFMNNDTEYDTNKKLHVLGSVSWNGSFNDTVSGSTRTITSNDLPIGATTGTFPIQASDPAYAYDKNPNTITAQSFTYALAANPTYGTTPNCIGGQVGVMLNGVALFSAFDAGGRDAGAWEVQDSCSGHPQSDGIYHYHTLSSCIKDVSVHTVIGFALDGFPITGPDVGTDNVLTTGDLDECHGITSQITLDGKSVTMYHYVMTQDFPYSVSCYRATPITPPGIQQPAAHP